MAMHRRTFLSATVALVVTALGGPGLALATDTMKISGPFAHENLAVYFLHGESASGPVPLTLQEALAKGAAHVYETGRVSELFVENTGSQEVFIQAGDIVKGGQQDRVLTVSLLLPAKSGKVPIASFCVEQGRWSARGREDVARFASATDTLPSREAKLALKQAVSGMAGPAEDSPRASLGVTAGLPNIEPRIPQQRSTVRSPGADGQTEIWNKVAETQRKLSDSLRSGVTSSQSATSLQLTLENEKVQQARAAFVTALQAKGEAAGDIIGVVVAVNGRISSAESYPSHGLFAKMWGKVLTAAATEAISERAAPTGPAPATGAVKDFLAAAETGKAHERELPGKAKLETRSSDTSMFSAAYGTAGQFIHRSYVAK